MIIELDRIRNVPSDQ